MTFAENLKRICASRETNPTAVCKALGLSTSKVSAWYNGSLPKQDIMVKLAQYLNCSVMDFFADDESIYGIKTSETPSLNEDEADLIRIYRSVSRRAKHEFMTMAYDLEKRAEREGDTAVVTAG